MALWGLLAVLTLTAAGFAAYDAVAVLTLTDLAAALLRIVAP